MHIEIHSISGHELLVETCEDSLEVTQVYREVSEDGRFHTITVVVEDLLVDDTDGDDVVDEYEAGYADGLADGTFRAKDAYRRDYVDGEGGEPYFGQNVKAADHRSTPDYMGLQGTDGTSRQGPSGIVDAHGYIRGNR